MSQPSWWVARLYPDPASTLFVRAIVFRRRRDLLDFGRELGVERVSRRTRAFCTEIVAWYGGQPGLRRNRAVAVVALWQREMGVGIVTHEFFHATAAWARRRGITTTALGDRATAGTIPREAPEEVLAEIQGELVRQFVDWAYRRNVYPDAA